MIGTMRFAAHKEGMQADLLHVKLAVSISFPAGEVILVSLQLLPLLLHASLHLLLLLLHPLKHLHISFEMPH